jgi:hypothetical protein
MRLCRSTPHEVLAARRSAELGADGPMATGSNDWFSAFRTPRSELRVCRMQNYGTVSDAWDDVPFFNFANDAVEEPRAQR